MDFVWWAVAGIGHLGVCAVAFNQIHATSYPRHVRKISERILALIALAFAVYLGWQMIALATVRFWSVVNANLANQFYLTFCLPIGAYFIGRWCYRKWKHRSPARVISRSVQKQNIQKQLGRSVYHGTAAQFLGCWPGNQAHWIASERLSFHVPRLPQSLEGLKICHLTDFHLTGQIDRSYFSKIVETANAFEPDLILVTGDLIDESHCMDWIEEIFGNLKATHGIYYVLGNHDRRIQPESMLRQRLEDSGMVGVSGKWQSICVRGSTIALTGNELPWFPHAANLKRLEEAMIQDFNNQDFENAIAAEDPLKILLSHSPDQVHWAAKYKFDLMFAGHTHGGQIQIPFIGPIVAPSRFGIRYASGTFTIGQMLMHVSRGISGDKCIRINCLPEVGLITLTGQSPSGSRPIKSKAE